MKTEERTLYAIKPRFVAALDGVGGVLARRNVAADTVTLTAVPVIVAVGAALVSGQSQPWLWLAIAPLCLVWMTLNAIDGSLARRTGTSTPRGAVLNELVDRGGDIVLLTAGLFIVPTWVAAAALVAVSTSETIALIDWAVNGERHLVGPMGKPDRALVIALGATAAVALGTGALTVAYGVVAVGAVITCWCRIRRAWSAEVADAR